MKLSDLYTHAIEEGIKQDPRGEKTVSKELLERKKLFDKLSKDEKEEFDQESLSNPYADTRILFGDKNCEVKRAIVGVDIEVGEIAMIDALNARSKKKIDLCIAHHPEGAALAALADVMGMQAEIFAQFGIPINIGEGLLHGRMQEVARKIHSTNHTRTVDAARLLDIPLICLHTVADNFVHSYLQRLIADKKPEKLEGIMTLLKEIPEYKKAVQEKAGPKILIGDPKRKAGKIIVEMTGGTGGPKELFDSYAQAGIGTIVGMHLGEEHYQKAQGKNINVIIAGHMASDSLGLNLLFDKIQKKGSFEIIPCSGFIRVERSTK